MSGSPAVKIMDNSYCCKEVRLSGYKATVRIFPAADKSAPAIIALHGFSGSGLDFLPLRDVMDAESWHWICPDFMGHGLSDSPTVVDPYSLCDSLRLIDFARSCVPEQSQEHLLGYSMGGRMALHYLNSAHPLPTAVIGASPGISSLEARRERKEQDSQIVELLQLEGIDTFARYWEEQPLIAPQTRLSEPLRTDLAGRRRNNDPQGLVNSLIAVGTGALPSLWDKLGCVRELHCLYGEKDEKFRNITKEMIIKNTALDGYSIPGCGHAAHLEAPEKVGEVLNSLFSR